MKRTYIRVKAHYALDFWNGETNPVEGEVCASSYDEPTGCYRLLVLMDSGRFYVLNHNECSVVV